jgi:hypothetical protein
VLDEPALDLERECGALVLEAVARPDLVDPDAVRQGARGSDERRIQRPFDTGDVDLDSLDLERRLSPLPALEGRLVAPPARRLVERDQRGTIVGKRLRRL